MIFRARWIYPVAGPPIENGACEVGEGVIQRVGRWPEFSGSPGQVKDLGEVLLCPGLINTHCHLDYTDVAGSIPPTRSFPDWVKTILSFKSHWSYSDYAASWLNGARMCLRSGMTSVVDIEAVPELLPEVWEATPLRVVSLFEMTGVNSGRSAAAILNEALGRIDLLPADHRCLSGLSPHAPYSTRPDLLRASGAIARERGLVLSTHLAESAEEFEMFARSSGAFHEWIGKQRNVADAGFGSPVGHAARNGLLGANFIAAHVNYTLSGDAELLANSGSHVVHCPMSHDYFSHRKFPYEELSRAGVNVCLGTDSLATARRYSGLAPRLSLWDEMQRFSRTYAEVSPRAIFRMCTVNAARALQREGALGCLKANAAADFIALRTSGCDDETRLCEKMIEEHAIQHVFISGEEAWSGSP
jgi:cytosine/adenosine deaminase-related metal-dependent hydrolase